VVQRNRTLANQVTSSIGRTQEKTVESEAMIEQVSAVINEISQAIQHVVEAVEGKVSNKIVQTSSSTAYRENCEKPYNQ
jgi:tRNA 2-selenouridine synthase SelU